MWEHGEREEVARARPGLPRDGVRELRRGQGNGVESFGDSTVGSPSGTRRGTGH